MKIFKIVLAMVWLVVLTIAIIISSTATLDYLSLVCWWFAAGWLFIVWGYKLKDIFSLKLSLGMFILGGIMVSFEFAGGGEVLTKFAFIILLIGFIQSLIEYKRNHNRHVK